LGKKFRNTKTHSDRNSFIEQIDHYMVERWRAAAEWNTGDYSRSESKWGTWGCETHSSDLQITTTTIRFIFFAKTSVELFSFRNFNLYMYNINVLCESYFLQHIKSYARHG
jgi:hypothetical protein